MASKKNITVEISDTIEYAEMLNRFNFAQLCKYLKNNQGKTLKNIVETFKEDEKLMEHLINIWIRHWNSFYQSGGRIIKNGDIYFCLSPTNPTSREKNPLIQSFIN